MLKEIYCDKFVSYGKIRNKIVFNPVLNVIEGSDTGKNSIGKSTFLMIIDFCFGGNDYIEKLPDVKANVGAHTVYFSFEFDKTYHFSRSTDNPNEIIVCNSDYTPIPKVLKLNEFTEFLKEKYSIPISGLSFRQIVSRFIRVYNRENLDEQLPLRCHKNEPERVSIAELIKLFKLFDEIKELNEQYEDACSKKDAFNKAQAYRYIPKITEKEYNSNKIELQQLTAEATELAERSDKGILDLPAEKAELIAKIKSEITTLKRQRSRLFTKLDVYKKDAEYEPINYQKDFNDLSEFFNNVNIEHLEEVENFHRKLSFILKKELKKAINDTWININLLSYAIKQYETELEQVQNTTNVSKVVLKAYAQIDRRIESLKKENDYHLQKKQIDNDVKQNSEELDKRYMSQIAILLDRINTKMAEINTSIYKEGTAAPVLYIPNPKSYIFETPNDMGTGTKYKGMIIFDLSVLQLTSLPIVVHDSIMFVSMENERVENTFALYEQSGKQVFVAIDRTTNLNDGAKNIIKKNRVLLLSPNGNELFGRAWNKQKGSGDAQ